MLESDTNESVELSIISPEGEVWCLCVAPDLKIFDLKSMVLTHFYNPHESVTKGPSFKFIVVSSKRVLNDDSSVHREKMCKNDEILLVERRVEVPKEPITSESQKGPTLSEIWEATQDLIGENLVRIPPQEECTDDAEFRRVLIALVEVGARLMAQDTATEQMLATITNRLLEPDPMAIKYLTEMGFPEDKAIAALKRKGNDAAAAFEYLLQCSSNASSSNESEENSAALGMEPDTSASTSVTKPHTTTVVETVANILETLRKIRKRDFKPNVKAMFTLKRMGFEEEEIVEALMNTGNTQGRACEWLLGDRTPSLENFDKAIGPESPIFDALISNPIVQLGLKKSKVILAFLSILEQPQSIQMWLSDPDTTQILSHVFKTYHTEKHFMTVNKYVETFKTPLLS